MKKLALALVFCSASAFSTTLTYSTSGVFSGPDLGSAAPPCPVGYTNCLVNGTANLVFMPALSTSVTPSTNINLGIMNLSGGSGSFIGDTFTLTITQTAPTPGGTSTSSTTVTGTVTSTSSGIDLNFSPTHFSIASNPAVTYTLQSDYFIVAPNTNSGETTLQAFASVAPEPASLGLMGASLLGLGLLVRRRANKK